MGLTSLSCDWRIRSHGRASYGAADPEAISG